MISQDYDGGKQNHNYVTCFFLTVSYVDVTNVLTISHDIFDNVNG